MTASKPTGYDAATPAQLRAISRFVSYRLKNEGVELPGWNGYPVASDEQVCDYLNRLLDLALPDLSYLSKKQASQAFDQLKPSN